MICFIVCFDKAGNLQPTTILSAIDSYEKKIKFLDDKIETYPNYVSATLGQF